MRCSPFVRSTVSFFYYFLTQRRAVGGIKRIDAMVGKGEGETRARLHSSRKQLRKTPRRKKKIEKVQAEKRRRGRRGHGTVGVLRGREAWDTRLYMCVSHAPTRVHTRLCFDGMWNITEIFLLAAPRRAFASLSALFSPSFFHLSRYCKHSFA